MRLSASGIQTQQRATTNSVFMYGSAALFIHYIRAESE
jgi:hypothetical protein